MSLAILAIKQFEFNLHAEAAYGHLNMVKSLVENNALLNIKNKDGITPLALAVQRLNNFEIIEFLIKRGANVNDKDNDGRSILTKAVLLISIESSDYINLLVKNGADVNNQDKEGNTPLHIAAMRRGSKKEYAILISFEADESIRNNDGKAPVDILKEDAIYKQKDYAGHIL